MPLQKLGFRPGINKQISATANEGGWSDGNLVRFRDGEPQPIGGWTAMASSFFTPIFGACRKLLSWATLSGAQYLAAGTSSNLYVIEQPGLTLYHDITPSRATFALTNPYAVTNGSSIVTMACAGHGALVGDAFITVTPTVTVGGLPIGTGVSWQTYIVASVIDANTITFDAGQGGVFSASSTTTGGGSVTATFMINSGPISSVPGGVDACLWSLDSWGEELVGCIQAGTTIYNWKPSGGFSTRAAVISGAPAGANSLLTAMPERHLVLFGAETGGSIDPLLVRWSDVEDYTTWTATATNSAGSFRLVGGSQIMCAKPAPQEILIWTDSVLYAMRFEGLPYVYGFFLVGSACGTIAPNACTTMNGVAYWMGREGFFRYAGRVEPIPCTVWDAVFRNLAPYQHVKIHCAPNLAFNEVTWFYPSASSLEVDSYVSVNVVDGTWTLGALPRTAWEDANVFSAPVAIDAGGNLFQHETGVTANGSLLDAWIESGYIDLADGGDLMFLDQVIPDFVDQSGTVNLTVSGRNFPNGAERSRGPYPVTSATRYLSPRIRARQLKARIESASTDAFWRFGAPRVRVAPDGRKA